MKFQVAIYSVLSGTVSRETDTTGQSRGVGAQPVNNTSLLLEH